MNTSTIMNIVLVPKVWTVIQQYLEHLNSSEDNNEQQQNIRGRLKRKDIKRLLRIWEQARSECML
jgi:hypothetical protein